MKKPNVLTNIHSRSSLVARRGVTRDIRDKCASLSKSCYAALVITLIFCASYDLHAMEKLTTQNSTKQESAKRTQACINLLKKFQLIHYIRTHIKPLSTENNWVFIDNPQDPHTIEERK